MSVIEAFKKRVSLSGKSMGLSSRRARATLMAAIVSLLCAPTAFSADAGAEPTGAKSGNVEAGKTKSAVCAACHGADGNSAAPNFPKLAGQGERYFVKQLVDMKTGARNVPEMTAFVQSLSETDMRDLAAYYASQTSTVEGADPELIEAGERLYRAGNPETGLAACVACHGAQGTGLAAAGFPMLGGQHAAYTEAQLKAFRAAGRGDSTGKKRDNDGDAKMMRSVAAKMSDSEIKALASYISGLY